MSVYRRKSGRWAVRIDADRNSDGKRSRKNLGTYVTKKEAESAERKALEARERGIDFDAARETVGATCDRYLERCRAKGLAPATVVRYGEIYRDLGGLRSVLLGRLARAQVVATYRAATDRGLSPKSLRGIHIALRAAVAWAAPESAALRALALAARDLPKATIPLARALDEREVKNLLQHVAGTPWEAFLTLALCTGARRSELAALRWSDVDFADNTVRIARSLAEDADGKLTDRGTKTGTERVVPLNALAVEALRSHRVRQNQERLAAGPVYVAEDRVFADSLGHPWNPRSISNAFRRVAKAAGVAGRLHDLRHSCATWLLQGGTDIRTVAAVLGHATAVTTLTTYAHVMPGAQARAVEGIAERLRTASGGQT